MRDFLREIEERKRAGLYRSRRQVSGPQQPSLTVEGQPLLSFCSNDYLGLANAPEARMPSAILLAAASPRSSAPSRLRAYSPSPPL